MFLTGRSLERRPKGKFRRHHNKHTCAAVAAPIIMDKSSDTWLYVRIQHNGKTWHSTGFRPPFLLFIRGQDLIIDENTSWLPPVLPCAWMLICMHAINVHKLWYVCVSILGMLVCMRNECHLKCFYSNLRRNPSLTPEVRFFVILY